MPENSLIRLFGDDLVKKNMPHIIDAFVEYYGEEEREFITERLNSILVLPFYNTETLGHILGHAKHYVVNETLGSNGIIGYTFRYSIDPDDFYEELTNRRFFFIKMLNSKELQTLFDGDDDIETIQRKVAAKEYPNINKFITQYQELKEKIAPYEKQLEEEKEREQDLKNKYYKMLVEEFKDLFPKEDLEYYEETGQPSTLMRLYIGYNIIGSPLCFDMKSELALTIDSESHTSGELNRIKENRIRFLQEMGVKLSGNSPLNEPTYEDYMNDPKAQELATIARRNSLRISMRKEELNKERKRETVYALKNFQKNKAIIDSINFVNKNVPICTYGYTHSVSLMDPNFIYDEETGRYIVSPIVAANMGASSLDLMIIHELNHAYELNVHEIDNKGYCCTCGWEEMEIEFSDYFMDKEINDDDIGEREMLSEYVNERLAQDITDILHGHGHCIYSMNTDKQCSSYMSMDLFLEPFFKEFLAPIKRSRSHGRINYLLRAIGEDNYFALNDLINRFHRRFGFDFEKEEIAYKKNFDTPETRLIKSMLEERDKILDNIREHVNSFELVV